MGAVAILWAIALAILYRPALAVLCDGVCQGQQRTALQAFYDRFAGSDWLDSTGWNAVDSLTPSALPAHCAWFGVTCCVSNVAVITFQYTPPLVLECEDNMGVVGLRFVSNRLLGSLSDTAALWSPLSTLLYLELSGVRLCLFSRF